MKSFFLTILFVLHAGAALPQQAVDLGLSVAWADRNMGADNPEHPGFFLAWGELEPKSQYSLANYRFGTGDFSTATKYVAPSRQTNSQPDNLLVLEPEDDVATVSLGEGWRMPTRSEIGELVEKCVWQWIDHENNPGYRVTGPNGQSIFLPAGGMYANDRLLLSGYEGYYWSQEVMKFNPDYACSLRFTPRIVNHANFASTPRLNGCNVRAVYVGQ